MDPAKVLADPRWAKSRVQGHVIVRFAPGYDKAIYARLLSAHGAKEVRELKQIGRTVIEADEAEIPGLVTDLAGSKIVVDAEPNSLGRSHAATDIPPNDPDYGNQWYILDSHVTAAWCLAIGTGKVTVAVIDSGCYPHPDLVPALTNGWNFLTETATTPATTTDTGAVTGHGTAVTGVVGAIANNGIGIAGVAYKCKIMPLTVLSAQDYAQWSDVAAAVMYAADNGAQIINISICGDSDSATLDSAMDYAWNKGCIIFAAAGNNGTAAMVYPAACVNVVSVAATQQGGTMASFSTFGSWVDTSAPGTPIYTTQGTNGYGEWEGTSFSCPIASATAVLMIEANPAITNVQIEKIVETVTIKVPGQTFGKINAYRCVQAAMALPPPSVAPISPPAAISPPSVAKPIASTPTVG
jgi:subtilisin family serine protease